GVKAQRRLSGGDQLPGGVLDQGIILAVDQRDQVVLAGTADQFQIVGALGVEGRRRHKELDAVVAVLQQLRHVGQRRLAHIDEDGCSSTSAIASRRACSASRSSAWSGVSPSASWVMLPIVVIPPASAAAEPLVKSSTHLGSGAPGRLVTCTCASTPPGSTSIPLASISRAPAISPPTFATRSPAIPTSTRASIPAVTTRPFRITRSSWVMIQIFPVLPTARI